MKLYVDRLKDSPTGYDFEATEAWRAEAEDLIPELRGALAEPIRVALRANRMGQDVYIEGAVTTALDLECSRCPVAVLLQRFEGSAFGTDEAVGEGILVVAANRADRLPHERHPKTTRRLTERAGDVDRPHGRGRSGAWSSSCSLSHLVI